MSFLLTELDWNWECKQYDLNEYIPDFIVCFNNGNELLIKVKKTMNLWKKKKKVTMVSKWYKKKSELRMETNVYDNVGISDYDGVSLGTVESFDDEYGFFNLPCAVLKLNISDGGWAIIDDSDEYDIGLYNGKNLDHHSLQQADMHTIFKEIRTKAKQYVSLLIL